MSAINRKLTVKDGAIGFISDFDDQSYGMFIDVAEVYGEDKDQYLALFTAAPEMYALIKKIHDMLPYFPANMDEMKKVYNEEIPQLLVKARGEA